MYNYSTPDFSSAHRLIPYAHWVTPKQSRKYRYDTRFFFCPVQKDAFSSLVVKADPKEVADIRWVSPAEALALHNRKGSGFTLPEPTSILMHYLSGFRHLDDLMCKYTAKYGSDGGSVSKMPRVEAVLDAISETQWKTYVQADWVHFPPGEHVLGPARLCVLPEGDKISDETFPRLARKSKL